MAALNTNALLAFVALVSVSAVPLLPSVGSSTPVRVLHGDASILPHEVGLAVTTYRTTYTLDTRGLAERIAAEGRYELQLGNGVRADLVLQEHDLFAPGQKYVERILSDGKVEREPILARNFMGHVAETMEPIFLTVAPEGLYAGFAHGGVDYSLQPRAWRDGIVEQEVVWEVVTTLDGAPRPEPALHQQLAAQSAGYWTIYVVPVAEPYWRALQSDWQNRIMNAYGYAISMWRSETTNDIVLMAFRTPSRDYADLSTACDGLPDIGLSNFEWYWVRNNYTAGANSYALFHGSYHNSAGWGCGSALCDAHNLGCLQPSWATSVVEGATHAVQAWDHHATDDYDATRSDHLGKAVAHELTHNAGQAGHPTHGLCSLGQQHLMAAGIPMSCRGTFRATTTKAAVNDYSHAMVNYE